MTTTSIRKARQVRRPTATLAVPAMMLATVALMGALCSGGGGNNPNHALVGFRLFTSPQADPLALSADGSRLYVANTTSNTVDVVDTGSASVIATIDVGVDPVSVAIAPGGGELWVSNHVSDSVSVVNLTAGPTQYTVVATIQATMGDAVPVIDIATGNPVVPIAPSAQLDPLVTAFDEPVGIAFTENGVKAYVALSSRNQVAVVDVASRSVTKLLQLTGQDPRALAVRGDLLYVPVFESMNQSELSICPLDTNQGQPNTDPPQCTMNEDAIGEFVTQPNLPNQTKAITSDPDVPDRDLFVFDTRDDANPDNLVASVSGMGTLLYGVAVDSTGRAFVSLADARNVVNGNAGDALVDLDNRMFDNMIADVSCTLAGCGAANLNNLDNPVPARSDALATPYGIRVSGDDSTLVVTAAGTSRLFTVDTATGNVLGLLDLGTGPAAGMQNPRGVALRSDGGGAPQTAYVLNTLENTVSVIDVSTPSSPTPVGAKIPVGNDPTPDEVRRGRMAFNNALASDSGNFSCGSCHPDGNTDQLLWRIGGACVNDPGCMEDEPRTTMPIRGLRYTLPLHWDGSLGDPNAGPNGATGLGGNEAADCGFYEHDCFRHLVDASLSGVMCDQSGPGCQISEHPTLVGRLTEGERSDMAFFLAEVSYPPARSRAPNDQISYGSRGAIADDDFDGLLGTDDTPGARMGFDDFFTDQGGLGPLVGQLGVGPGVNTCADTDAGCHGLPLTAGTDSETLGAFDIPTMRGLNDRFIQFSNAITTAEEVQIIAGEGGTVSIPFGSPPVNVPVTLVASEVPYNASHGYDELVSFAGAFNVFSPVYNVGPFHIFQMVEEASTGYSGAFARQVTLNTATAGLTETDDLLADLEAADSKGLINLRGTGIRNGAPVVLSFRGDGTYKDNHTLSLTRADLLGEAGAGTLVLTLTGNLGAYAGDPEYPQPVLSPQDETSPRPQLPVLPAGNPMTLTGVGVADFSEILLDGVKVAGTITCVGGTYTPTCNSFTVEVNLASPPTAQGLYMLQIATVDGLVSNELPICVPRSGTGAALARCDVPEAP